MRTLVVSGRAPDAKLADACAHDFEDAIIDALGADILLPGASSAPSADPYDLVITCGITFDDLRENIRLIRKLVPKAGRTIGYLFGAYGVRIEKKGFGLRRHIHDWRKEFRLLDRLYLGIAPDADQISADLGVPTRYLPMAANVLAVQARPFANDTPRAIDVNAFGRQHKPILDEICDRYNRPGSGRIVFRSGLLLHPGATDLARYRQMFWQILRNSQISMTFDQVYNPAMPAIHSYIGPRWWESLAAGTVVVGRAPATAEARRLLDWEDATIDIPDEAKAAADAVDALLADRERLQRASRNNLRNMYHRHDWRHRLAELMAGEGLPLPPRLEAQLAELSRHAGGLSQGLARAG